MDIIRYRDGARDFYDSGISSLNKYGVGDAGQQAENAYQWNEIEDDIEKNIQQYEEYEYEDYPDERKHTDITRPGINPFTTLLDATNQLTGELFGEKKYQGENGKKTTLAEQIVDINTRDALTINIEARKKELMDTEARWLPQIQLAQQYIQDKQRLIELQQLERGQATRNINGGSFMEEYAELYDRVQQEEQDLREAAKTNPYLTDIFFGDAEDPAHNPLTYGSGKIEGPRLRSLLADGKLSKYWEDLSWSQNNNELDNEDNVAKSLLDIKYQKILEKNEEAQRNFDKKSDELLRKQHSLKTAHMLYDPLLGIVPLFVTYDPKNIDPVLDEERSNTEISITDPSSWKYGLLHLGSSASEIQAMAAQVVISGAVKYGSKVAGAYTGPAAPLVWATGEAALGLMSTMYFRHKETAAETMSNYSEKISTLAAQGKFDVNKVLEEYQRQLNVMGYDTESMDELEILQFGLAYNLKTSDPNYQAIAKDARKGLTKLEEINNALSLSDYAQNFGLSYGGKLMRESFGLKTILKGASNLANKNKATAKVLKTLTGKVERSIDKVLSNPASKMATRRALENAANMGARLGKNWIAERTEEGIQGLAGREYANIPLDYVEKPTDDYNLFRGMVKAGDLAVEANLAYHGLHWNDLYNTDEQLKREMEIGGFIGAFMGGASNFSNANELRKQLRSDLHLRGLAAEGFDKAETSYKTAQFLDSYRKGNNSKYLQDSLESFKKYKSEGVTDAMIDDDIEIAKTVYGLYKNKAIKQNLSDLNIDRRKDKSFEIFVQNAVDIKRRFDDSNASSKEADRKVKERMNLWLAESTDGSQTQNNLLKEFVDREYDRYVKQNSKDRVSKQEFSKPIINAISARITNNVLKQLKKDLKLRKKTLQDLKKEYGINTSVAGIEGMLKYIEDSQKDKQELQDKYNELMFKGSLDRVADPIEVEEMERLIAISIINQGITHSLSARMQAYYGGRVQVSDRYLIEQKPLFSTLSEESKQKVMQEYSRKYKESKGTDKEPTAKQVIAFYNHQINMQWNSLEESANVEAHERFLANSLIQQDLAKGFEELDQAKAELNEETGMEAANNDQEAVIEQVTEEVTEEAAVQPPVETPSKVEPTESTGKDKEDTSQEKATSVDEVSESSDRNSTPAAVDGVQVDVDTAVTEDPTNNEGDTVVDIDTMLDDVAENGFTEEPEPPFNEASIEEAVSNQEEAAKNDGIVEDEEIEAIKAKLDGMEDGEPLAVVDEVESVEEPEPDPTDMQDDSAQTSEEPTVQEQKPEADKPEEEVVKPKTTRQEKPTTDVTVESFDGSTDDVVQVVIDDPSTLIYSDGESVWVGNEDPGLGVQIPEDEFEMQTQFEQIDAVDMGTTEEAAAYLGQTDKSPGLDTKKKVESNRIHSTFFFSPTSEEAMVIQANGKPVVFDGERRPGAELADKLATPGWLAKQRVYYIVTDSAQTRKQESNAADRLAVHMIIEEEADGKKYIYNASLYEPEKARSKVRKWGVSKDKQDAEVRKLRELRKKIIDKYITTYAPNYFSDPKATLPQTAPKGITPVGLRQSNGSINSQATPDKRPIYRPLTTVEEFGLSSDPVEMSRQILEGEVEFGYGKGPFPLDPADRFTIVHFDEVTPATAQGVGYAGKIYIIPRIDSTPSQRHSAPIMLAEKRHFIPGGSRTLVTSYTPQGVAKNDDQGKRIPLSSAELIFRLITRTLPNSGQPLYQDLLHILCNHGPSTVTLGDNRVEKLSFYVRKTLHAYTNNRGEDFLMYGHRTPEGSYLVKYLKIRDARGNVVFTEQQAYDVIRQISNNIHWNTDKVSMMEPISDNIVEEAISYMQKYNTDYYRVLNCEDLVFTTEDLNLERLEDGSVVRKGETPILMSWMVNHQVLKTDVGDKAFRAPFMYADDAAVAETDQVSTEPTKEEKAPKKPAKKPTQKQQQAEPEQAPQQVESTTETATKPSTQDRALTYDETVAMGLTPKQGFTHVLKADGTTVILPNSSAVLKKLTGNTRGAYSTVRGEGTIDIDSAKQWLYDKLGIDKDDVLVTNAIIDMPDAAGVFGLVKASFSRILHEFRPTITLSTKAGEGLEYHEAWHYVSLIILNDNQRNQVYSDFLKRNPQYKDYTKRQLEEVLAEEFRAYVLKETNPSIGYRMLKFFKAIWKMVNIFGSKDINLQSEVFEAIRKGKFRNKKASQEVLEEFSKNYPFGVAYYAPGISDEEQAKVPHITNASTMYNIIESLSSTALSILNIRSMEDIQRLSLSEVFDTIQYMYDSGEYDSRPANKMVVEDVLLNKGMFAKQIKLFLQELGVRSIEQEQTRIAEEEALQNGDTYDNIWDRASYEISKKANTAFNAKLFFYSIPQSRFVLDENGVQQLDSVKDNVFGLDMVQPFDITWNKILDNLWQSNDWPDLIKKVRNNAKADPFFARLLERIDNPNYPLPENTITELLTTIQSAKNSMDTVTMQPDAAAKSVNKAAGRRIWTVRDSDSLRKIARLPGNWSQNFMVSSMVTVDDKNRSIIDNKSFQKLKKLDARILNSIDRINKSKDVEESTKLFLEAKNDFLELVNMIGIPFDNDALTFLLNKIRPKNTNSIPGFEAFNILYTAKDKKQSKNSNRMVGSISNSVISNIQKMRDGKSLEVSFKKQTISGSRIFNYKSPNAAINLMAIAYGETHPTPEEFSVTGADGSLLYPITQNNYMSDQLRWLNTNAYNKLQNLANAAYSKNSLIVKALLAPDKPKLKLHTLIAINDDESGSSRDYFGISPLEDYITKMVLAEHGRIILPTMSDKKTWYSIEGIDIPKDFLVSVESAPDEFGNYQTNTVKRRFSSNREGTGTLDIFFNYFLDEYNAVVNYYNTKSDVEKNKSRYYDNYHGKIGKDGKMKPGGNGGRFRYFNQLPVKGEMMSLNKLLADAEESGDPVLLNNALDNIKKWFIDSKSDMYTILNDLLLDKVDKEIEQAIKLGVIGRNKEGHLTYKNLPSPNQPEDADGSENPNVFAWYKDQAQDIADEAIRQDDIIYSMIANYVTAYAISIEEIEKCFVGDPAMYKWKSNEAVGIFQRDVDKIKRLSSALSTGTNLRTYWGENDPRNTTKFVSAIMQDNMIGSEYHSQLEQIFKASFTRTMLKKTNPEYTDDQLFELTNEQNLQSTLDSSLITEDDRKFIEKQSKKAADPYAYDDENNSGNINQADAAVYIRPAFYKKIMQSLGEWSDEIEQAYNILESDGIVDPETGKLRTPMNDPELYQMALKASIKPLKMMYFGDHFDNVSKINVPVFDKMAIFPMFKILATGDNKYLYDRMNDKELGEIDMLKFESATKVGSPRDKFRPYLDNKNAQFNIEGLQKPSTTIVSQDDSVQERMIDGITTRVQDLKQLRLQLNTEPHEATDRSFGTQAIKIGMANIVDDRTYGGNKGLSIKGSQIKDDIFGTIKALSTKGYRRVSSRFFDKSGRMRYDKLSEYLIKEASGTNMSMEIVEALKLNKQGRLIAPIASLSVRNWIESKVISLINKEVIDVNTPGGSAIQMASFGFRKSQVRVQTSDSTIQQNELLDINLKELGMSIRAVRFLNTNNLTTARDLIKYGQAKLQKYGGERLYTEFTQMLDEFQLSFDTDTSLSTEQLGVYASYNNGKKLSFEPSKGSMEVMLSTNFFRSVIPKEFQTDYATMRNWLIENGVIGNGSQPYGVGYRIPTQGLSSTFSFIVADVLPEHTGDTIVVPDEFTAMTGSDFDIDKLYIATYSYDPQTNQRYQFDDTKDYNGQTEGALINKLIDSYTLVISDEKTLAETRASIDTLTGILKSEILPKVQVSQLEEAAPMYELMPSFQGSRKTEYTSGKAGIAPFALNSTNHCLTQATHLTMRYSNEASKYGLGELDAIEGQDSYKILDWLSAMINAHVDVAKDPYIIALNVNNVTYNMTNLLLRGGKGKTTFLFLAQPAIKEFANRKIMNNGVVGVNKQFDNNIIRSIRQKYLDMLDRYTLTLSQAAKEQIQEVIENGSARAFDEKALSSSLEAFKDGEESVQDIVMQLICLKAYQSLASDAQTLADLVQRSQIDTKKYGNNLSQLHNFDNSYYTFIKDHSNKFRYTQNNPENPNKGYDSALEMYFNETFLQQKLDYTVDLADRILKSQVFSATDGYQTIFTQVMNSIRGGRYTPIRRGKTLQYLYKSTSDKVLVKKLNDRIESIVRARIAVNNTDIRIEDAEINELLFGKDNIAKRLNEIKSYIRQNKDQPSMLTLVDEYGNINNDMLNYLQAITTNKKNALKRISTSTSVMDNSRYFDDRLISAFYDLLTNDDPTISEFAQLLVKYAFLTSYDNRTPNSFFQLVPMMYKQDMGYVSAIANAIAGLNRNEISVIGGSTDINTIGSSIYLNLARNYWKDNDIVPVYVRRVTSSEEDGGNSWSNTVDLAGAKDKSNAHVSTVITVRDYYDITQEEKFIKIIGSRNNTTMLYQKVGYIVDLEQENKTVELVYVAVPKLGFDSGANSVYELYKEGNEQSAFESNQFTTAMIEQTTTELPNIIQKYLERYKKRQLAFWQDPEYMSVEIAEYKRNTPQITEEGQPVEPSDTIDEPQADSTSELGGDELQPNDFIETVGEQAEQDELGSVGDDVIDYLDNIDEDSSLQDDLDTILDLDPTDVIDEVMSSTEELGFDPEPETDISDMGAKVERLAKEGVKRKLECD